MQTRPLVMLSRPFIAERSIHSRRWSLVARLIPPLLFAACSDDAVSPSSTGGTAGASATAGSGGAGSPGGAGTGGNDTTGAGGSSGSNASGSGGSSGAMSGGIRDNPEFGFKVPCPPPAQALLLDFSPNTAEGDPGADAGGADAAAPAPVRDTTFGTFGVSLAGGTYSYPADGMWPIRSDVSQGHWHLTGDVGTFSGFGIYIGGCNVLDASAYDGVSFTIAGSVAMGGALTLNVATSANDVSHVWLNTVAMPPPATPAGVNSGRCIPASNQYDGSCASPSLSVPVTAEPATVTVLWSQLTGGSPAPTVDPTEIVSISWTFPAPPGAGDPAAAMPYPVDVVIDDIGFVDNP
jgi:hypothetical protein